MNCLDSFVIDPNQDDFIEKLEEVGEDVLFKIRTDSEIYLLGAFNVSFFSEVLKFMQKVS